MVTISVDSEGKQEIVHVEEVVKPFKPTIVTGESKTTKEVSVVTGSHITVSTKQTEVVKQSQVVETEVIKAVPIVKPYKPVSVQTTSTGDLDWTSIVYNKEEKNVQVTTLHNITSNKVTVIDSKEIVRPTPRPGKPSVTTQVVEPKVRMFKIPSMAIERAMRRMPRIRIIVREVLKTQVREAIEWIIVEDFGTKEKMTVVIKTSQDTQEIVYIINKKTSKFELIQSITVDQMPEG